MNPFAILLAGAWLAVGIASAAVAPRPAAPCTLQWDPSAGAKVAGYALYYGPANGSATNRVNVGAAGTVTLGALSSSVNYFFYVVAYDATGGESVPSNVIFYQPPMMSKVKLTHATDGTMRLQFSMAAGSPCRVEYTDSLEAPDWQTLTTATADANGDIVVLDPPDERPPCRFYRAVSP
jgi:hypothetical protein